MSSKIKNILLTTLLTTCVMGCEYNHVSSQVYTGEVMIIDASNYYVIEEDVVKIQGLEDTSNSKQMLLSTSGYIKSKELKGLKTITLDLANDNEYLKVYNTFDSSNDALYPDKLINKDYAKLTYTFEEGNEFSIVNNSSEDIVINSIIINYTGKDNSNDNNNNNNSSNDNKDDGPNEIVSTHYKGTYYNGVDLTLLDSALKTELRQLISSTHTNEIDYDDLRYNTIAKADASLTNPSKVVCIYSREEVDGSWDSGKTWNREHVWPQSVGWGKSTTEGSDLHHVRPETPSVNSSRGNTPFGERRGYYEPKDAAKGDVARILFYMLTRYSSADSKSITVVAESMELLMEWNELDPVDALEMQRNDVAEDIQGNRNPFIDYPELAENIWA